MKHFARRIAFLSAVVLALALSLPAFAQSTEGTETSTRATTTSTHAVSATTSTRSAGSVMRQQTPKRVRRKISATSSDDYRNPQGSVLSAFFFGVGYSSDTGTIVAFGLGLGYAMFTGVVPGLRAELIYNDGFGGELAATMTLTPPLNWSLTPFLLGEAGLHAEHGRQGWMYGAGTGVYLGDPSSHLAIQIGWVWRAIVYSTQPTRQDGSGPLLAITYRF